MIVVEDESHYLALHAEALDAWRAASTPATIEALSTVRRVMLANDPRAVGIWPAIEAQTPPAALARRPAKRPGVAWFWALCLAVVAAAVGVAIPGAELIGAGGCVAALAAATAGLVGQVDR
jgi:hypothetical protein